MCSTCCAYTHSCRLRQSGEVISHVLLLAPNCNNVESEESLRVALYTGSVVSINADGTASLACLIPC